LFQVFYLFLENFDSENNLSMDLSEVNNDHLLGFIFKRLPFLDWIRTYNLKEFFLKDLIAGLSVIIISLLFYL